MRYCCLFFFMLNCQVKKSNPIKVNSEIHFAYFDTPLIKSIPPHTWASRRFIHSAQSPICFGCSEGRKGERRGKEGIARVNAWRRRVRIILSSP